MSTQPISFDDLGGKQVSPPPAPMNSRAKAASFAQRPAPAQTTQQARPAPIDFSDLGGKRVDQASTRQTPPATTPAPQPEDKPGILERAYETSGLKGIIDSAKAKGDADDAARKEITEHVKNGRWGHAAEAILKHVVGPAAKAAAMGPEGEFLAGVAQHTYQHGKAAIQAGLEGKGGEAVENTAEAVPILGQIGETIGKPLGQDIGNENYRGVAGDVIGGVGSLALMRAGAKSGSEPVEPVSGAPLAVSEAQPGLARSATKLLSKTGTAEKPMGEFMGNRTAALRNAAEKISPEAGTPEVTGAAVQGGARDVLGKQEQAQQLTKDFTDRAAGEVDNARKTATEKAGTQAQQSANKEISDAQSATEQAGKQAQDEATQQLHARRTASVEGGKSLAKDISGADELPVPEGDREIISSLRGANEGAKAEESAAHNALSDAAKAKGITVKTQPMQAVAKEVVGLEGPAKDLVMSSLPATVYKTLEKVASSSGEGDVVAGRARDFGWDANNLSPEQAKEIQKDLVDHPSVKGDPNSVSEVPYQVMKTARTAVGEALQSARKHFQTTGMGSNAQRVLQQLYGGCLMR
jgi:hypothetical protein